MYTFPYVKQMTSASLMREAGYPKLVLWDNPKGQGGEGNGRGFQDGATHVHPWLIHVDVWQKSSQYCKVIILQLNKSFFFLSRVNHHQKHPALLYFFSPLRRQPGEHPSHLWLFSTLEATRRASFNLGASFTPLALQTTSHKYSHSSAAAAAKSLQSSNSVRPHRLLAEF